MQSIVVPAIHCYSLAGKAALEGVWEVSVQLRELRELRELATHCF